MTPAITQPPAARAREVTKVYGRGPAAVTALGGISLDIPVGSFTAVMGPSGSGKSTLMHCMAGLDRPTSGEIWLAGQDLRALSENRLTMLRREQAGFVFQSFNLLPSLNAEQNVALPLRLAGRRPASSEVRGALAAVGLAGRLRHRPAELSGGQQQRVAIARALVTRPAVLFADEPTGMLDSAASRDVLALLRAVTGERTQTVIMVTHDPAAAACADRVLFLADGRLAGELPAPTPRSVAARMADLESAGASQ